MSTSRSTRTTTSTTDRTMAAVLQEVYGDTEDVLRVGRTDVPEVGDDDVLVRVRAAGIDRGVWHLMAGKPYAARLAFGLRRPKNPVRGREFAGVVAEVGGNVSTLRPGDEVFGTGEGTLAEYVVARAGKIALMPRGAGFDQSAAVPISGATALQAVRVHGRVRAGQSVLVIGASGGVGSFAVQIAKADGAVVTGVSSGGKMDFVRSLGADSVIDYASGEIPEDGRYDVVLDIGGNRPLRRLRRMLTRTGTLVFVGGEDGGRWLGLGRQLRGVALSPFVGQRLVLFVASENAADLDVLGGLVASGAVTPAVDRAFPLEEAPAAIGYLRTGRVRGKVVVRP